MISLSPRIMPAACLVALLTALGACASSDKELEDPTVAAGEKGADPLDDDLDDLVPKEGSETIDNVIAAVDNKAQTFTETDLKEPGDEISHATTQQIPIEINADVERWIDYFTAKDSERFRRFLERGEKYKAMVSAVLKDQGIPTEIYYQAMIESGFSTHAKSQASAVGIWQFIKGTGKRYGLRIDQYVDERRDPMRATVAAALYMKDLYNVFQSWYLALAAYNAGEGRILGAIMRAKTRDFWEMVKMRALPDETMNYIPKFLAATIIGHNLEKYGFAGVEAETMPQVSSVAVPSPVRLSDVAKVSGISLETLKELNPHILRGVTPPGASTYRVWVPKDQVAAVDGQLETLASLRLHNLRPSVSVADSRRERGDDGDERTKHHVVARGETLGKIAGIYGTSVSTLMKLNGLKSTRVFRGMRLVVWKPASTKASKSKSTASSTKRYRVKRGDNLDSIARRFNSSVEDLKRLNRMKRNTVYIGQMLNVPRGERSI